MAKVWVYYHGNHDIGGGGADVKVYSSAAIAIQKNPHNWELTPSGSYKLKNEGYYEQVILYEAELDSE